MASQIFKNLELKHIEFNAQRTLRTAKPSLFETRKSGELLLLQDANIAFANQILSLNQQSQIDLADALTSYKKINMSPCIDIKHDDLTDSLKTYLTSLGFELVETLNFLSIQCADIQQTIPKIEVERLQPKHANMFLDLLKTSSLQCTDDIWQLKQQHYCTERFRCFIAKIDGQPRALATTFIDEQYGLLANAFTPADFQNIGCQTALLTARLQDAKSLGLSTLIVDVIPNTTSERNCLKLGFQPLETRYIWQKPDK